MAYAYQITGWLDGVKIRRKIWGNEVFICLNEILWMRNDGRTWSHSDLEQLFCCDDWEVYEEPKKKVTRWLWTCKRGVSLSSFAANPLEISAREYGRSEEVSLKDIEENWIKLPWSATEFDS